MSMIVYLLGKSFKRQKSLVSKVSCVKSSLDQKSLGSKVPWTKTPLGKNSVRSKVTRVESPSGQKSLWSKVQFICKHLQCENTSKVSLKKYGERGFLFHSSSNSRKLSDDYCKERKLLTFLKLFFRKSVSRYDQINCIVY